MATVEVHARRITFNTLVTGAAKENTWFRIVPPIGGLERALLLRNARMGRGVVDSRIS